MFFGPNGLFDGVFKIPDMSTGNEDDSITREIWGSQAPSDPRVHRRAPKTSRRSERSRDSHSVHRTKRPEKRRKRVPDRDSSALHIIAGVVKEYMQKMYKERNREIDKVQFKEIAKKSTEKIHDGWRNHSETTTAATLSVRDFLGSDDNQAAIRNLLTQYFDR
jgi:hypothetical protein